MIVNFNIDKQQELDLPSLRVDDSEVTVKAAGRKAKETSAAVVVKSSGGASGTGAGSAAGVAGPGPGVGGGGSGGGSGGGGLTSTNHMGRTMSHISGVKRPLSHSNSLTSEKVPKYGVDTSNEHELGKVIMQIDFIG